MEKENERFKRLIKAKGFNTSSFAREIESSVQVVQHWEKSRVSRDYLEIVAKKLEVTIDYLIKGK